jgi:hypothetical protein
MVRSLAIFAALLVGCAGCSGGDDGTDAGSSCSKVCPGAGGTCEGEICKILGGTERIVSCPSGIACEVDCAHASQACRDGVRCAGATTCTVICAGPRACQAGVDCSASTCAVTCNGDQACEGGIRGEGGTCTSHCCGVDACALGTGTCVNDNQCP